MSVTHSARPRKSLAERFWSHVDQSGGPDTCWLWTGETDKKGYGRFYPLTPTVYHCSAHRMAWELSRGPIPLGLMVCHHCDVRPCCNPAHLFLGTAADNNADMGAKGHAARLGETNGSAKLTEAQVLEIRARHAAGAAQRALAREYGVHHRMISRIVRREKWTHV